MKEHYFQCPFCWEQISMLFDTSINSQKYIEDCEVCCNPLEINCSFKNSVLVNLEVKTL